MFQNIDLKKYAYQYFMVALGCIIMSVAINAFYVPNKMLSGGISGVAALAYYIADLPMGMVTFVCNVPLFFLAVRYMNKAYFIGSLYGMICLSIALDAFHFLTTYTVVHDKVLACIAGGALYGLGTACMYRVGGNSGGTDIIGAIVQKHYSISISTTVFLLNMVLLAVSSFFFGIEPVLYTMLAFFVVSKTSNAFTIGFDFKKNIIIISNKHLEIAEEIIKVVGRGVTYLHGEGAFTHQEREVLFVVVKLTQLAKIKEICHSIDPDAFLIIHDVNDVFGRGFTLKSSGPSCPRPEPPKEVLQQLKEAGIEDKIRK